MIILYEFEVSSALKSSKRNILLIFSYRNSHFRYGFLFFIFLIFPKLIGILLTKLLRYKYQSRDYSNAQLFLIRVTKDEDSLIERLNTNFCA